jgi:hypothetical protein
MHAINLLKIGNMEWPWIQVCIPMLYGKILSHYLKDGRAQVKGYVESPQVDIDQVWQYWELFKLKRSTKYFYSFLSIGMPYYQEGCNLASWPRQSAH